MSEDVRLSRSISQSDADALNLPQDIDEAIQSLPVNLAGVVTGHASPCMDRLMDKEPILVSNIEDRTSESNYPNGLLVTKTSLSPSIRSLDDFCDLVVNQEDASETLNSFQK